MMEGKGCIIKDEAMAMTGNIEFVKSKSYSIIAKNLETVNDVDEVIRQCILIKKEMTGELLDNLNLRQYLDVPSINFMKSCDTGDYHKPII